MYKKENNHLPNKIITWALETPRIGARPQLPPDVVRQLCSFFKCQPSEVSTRAWNFASLLGLDNQNCLLKSVTHIQGFIFNFSTGGGMVPPLRGGTRGGGLGVPGGGMARDALATLDFKFY